MTVLSLSDHESGCRYSEALQADRFYNMGQNRGKLTGVVPHLD